MAFPTPFPKDKITAGNVLLPERKDRKIISTTIVTFRARSPDLLATTAQEVSKLAKSRLAGASCKQHCGNCSNQNLEVLAQ